MVRSLTDAVGAALSAEVVTSMRLAGGDVAESFRLDLDDGRTVFAKTHRSPPPLFFTTEAAGLKWLAEPDVIAVPSVLAVSDGVDDRPPYLVLEWVEVAGGRGATDDETQFGCQLAALHRSGADVFGRTDRRTTGSRGLPNEPCENWVEFFATQRLEPLTRLSRDSAALDERDLTRIEWVAEHLGELGGPPEPAARLHGDLWAGNRLVGAAGTSWLIDPAAHGGHREYDLAMMRLFGGFGDECFDAYDDALPLADGWRERVPLHQLAPLVVHAVKFGGGYRAAVSRALDQLGGP